MSYTEAQQRQIVRFVEQRLVRLKTEGCPMCGSATAGYRSGRVTIPNFELPLLAIECRSCGHLMLFNEQRVLAPLQ